MIRKTLLAGGCVFVLKPPVRSEEDFEVVEEIVVIFRPLEEIFDHHFPVGRVVFELGGRPVLDAGVDGRGHRFFLSLRFLFLLGVVDCVQVQFVVAETEMAPSLEGPLVFQKPRVGRRLSVGDLQNRRLESRFPYVATVDKVVGQRGLQHLDGVVQNHGDEILLADVPASFKVIEFEDVHDEGIELGLHEPIQSVHEDRKVNDLNPSGVKAFIEPFGPKTLLSGLWR